jgi:hydrogenase expression/formation protein HypE
MAAAVDLSAELLRDVFLPLFSNPVLDRMDDQAVVEIGGSRVAFTTDSFVVKPLFFPGGDIGSLAVHGTITTLRWVGHAAVSECGFHPGRRIFHRKSAPGCRFHGAAAAAAGVTIVTGDTKVVERGKGDGVFINTTGIGIVPEGVSLSANQARPGDRVILSGSIGDHGIAIMASREGLGIRDLRS